jgi:hypothetical protein
MYFCIFFSYLNLQNYIVLYSLNLYKIGKRDKEYIRIRAIAYTEVWSVSFKIIACVMLALFNFYCSAFICILILIFPAHCLFRVSLSELAFH